MLRNLNAWECLERLLDYGQFELLDYKRMASSKAPVDCRVIYLMNDTAESLIVFRNARYTGEYIEDYEGEISYSLDEKGCVLRVDQGENHFLLFFDALEMETHLYDYGGIGHFWVKGNENLRNLEFQIVIIRDKYDFLGAESCSELERKLASLKNFPPLNYLFYPAVSDKYITPMEDPWAVSGEALDFFETICETVGDHKLRSLVRAYRKRPGKRVAKKIAVRLQYTRHKAVPDKIFSLICEAGAQYPKRTFGEEERRNQALLERAEKRKEVLTGDRQSAVVYREEPFTCYCDDLTFKVYVMVLQDGMWKRRISVKLVDEIEEKQSRDRLARRTL